MVDNAEKLAAELLGTPSDIGSQEEVSRADDASQLASQLLGNPEDVPESESGSIFDEMIAQDKEKPQSTFGSRVGSAVEGTLFGAASGALGVAEAGARGMAWIGEQIGFEPAFDEKFEDFGDKWRSKVIKNLKEKYPAEESTIAQSQFVGELIAPASIAMKARKAVQGLSVVKKVGEALGTGLIARAGKSAVDVGLTTNVIERLSPGQLFETEEERKDREKFASYWGGGLAGAATAGFGVASTLGSAVAAKMIPKMSQRDLGRAVLDIIGVGTEGPPGAALNKVRKSLGDKYETIINKEGLKLLKESQVRGLMDDPAFRLARKKLNEKIDDLPSLHKNTLLENNRANLANLLTVRRMVQAQIDEAFDAQNVNKALMIPEAKASWIPLKRKIDDLIDEVSPELGKANRLWYAHSHLPTNMFKLDYDEIPDLIKTKNVVIDELGESAWNSLVRESVHRQIGGRTTITGQTIIDGLLRSDKNREILKAATTGNNKLFEKKVDLITKIWDEAREQSRSKVGETFQAGVRRDEKLILVKQLDELLDGRYDDATMLILQSNKYDEAIKAILGSDGKLDPMLKLLSGIETQRFTDPKADGKLQDE